MSLPVSVGYKARLALPRQRRARLITITKKDDSVVGWTSHDRPIVYGGVTYAPGYNSSDVVGESDLSNDNLEYQGILRSPDITEEALRIGEWDNLSYVITELFWDDHSLGVRFIRAGTMGEISLDRFHYSAQLDGMAKKYATIFGNLTQPGCRRILYDEGCTVDEASHTVTGELSGAAADGFTIYADDRTEDGPSGGIDILDITNDDSGVVGLATAPVPPLRNGQPVYISGVLGMVEVNTQVVAMNPSSDGLTFEIGDTSDFGAYTSGGTMTPVGADSSIFDGGVLTMITGPNAGSSMEVIAYVTGQLTIALPFPYLCEAGDEYSLTEGCNKNFFTGCIDHFDNAINFDGEPYMIGNDRLAKIGKQP